jgi:hypothetical protein
MVVAGLAINRGAYAIATWLKNMERLPQQESDDMPLDGRHDDVHCEHNRHQNAHSDRVRRIWGCDLSSRFTESARTTSMV